MGIFDFFKKKKKEHKISEPKQVEQKVVEEITAIEKNTVEEYYTLPFFGKIAINNIKDYYSTKFELNNRKIKTDLNFNKKEVEKIKIEHIENILKNVEEFDRKNKSYIEEDFKITYSETVAYINFYLEELDENELKEIIGIRNPEKSMSEQLINKLELIRIGFYPQNEFGSRYFITFDYSIDIDGEPCNQLLVVNTSEKGTLDHITWES